MRFTCAALGLVVLPAAGFGADTRIAEAAMHQDNSAVRALIQQKADVNATLPDGATALHWAANEDDLDTVSLLIQAGANVKAKDRYGFTPLYFASTNGSAAVIRKLLDAGADPNAADSSGETALMTATRSGNVDAVKILLQHGADVKTKDAVTQQTPLMWAVRSNFPAAVDLYLEYGAEINARTRTGKTPAARPPGAGGGSHGAGIVRSGWPEQGFQGETPGGMTPLLYAARDGRVDIARILIAAKADVQQADVNGITPLLMAITNNHLDTAKFLLEKGAAVNAADWWGRAPLYATVEIRNRDYGRNNEHEIDRPAALEVIRMLLDRGANVNARTKEVPPTRRFVTPLGDLSWVDFTGQTPFLRAALAGDITVMRLLLEKGADPNIATFAGTTALMAASGVNWMTGQTYTESKEALMEAVQLCLDKGGDVNAKNSMGVTAVIGAANRGSDDILEFLVKKGARLDIKDKEGRTPLVWAEGVFLATNAPEAKPSTMALIKRLMAQ
ncbi:MAG: ankyrin repeat domain-containing protein [Acidobacteriia bacterium]|nr:ankyrin repeat domain-containing protein [Terriglobia bacterium]